MKIVQFYKSGYIHLGIKKENRFFDITSANRSGRAMSIANSTLELVKGGKQERRKVESIYDKYKDMEGFYIEENEIVYAPCISSPEKILCIGLNYAEHAKESGMDEPQEPIVFSKFANTLAGHQENIKLPLEAKKVDYEAELAIVIGEKARNIDENDASKYIYGYCVSNDVSARDLQFKSSQWLLGKNCDGFAPVGPMLITKDEVENINNLNIKTFVNDEVRQHSNTSDMIFNCEQIVSYLSKYMTLQPGDVIMTGTPEGVIMGLSEEKQIWLKSGDNVKVEIEGIGILENNFINESK